MGGALSSGVVPGNQGDITLAVAGRRGSGKSTFINTAAGRDILPIGHALKHNPYDILPIECVDPDNKERRIFLVELPGFDCESLELYEKKLKQWLRGLSSKKLSISGILYLHPITDVRISTTASWLKALCEHTIQGSPKQMVLVTTKWGGLRSVATGVRRERDCQRYWDELTKGPVARRTLRFEDSTKSAWSIVADLMENPVCGSPVELFIPPTISGEKQPINPVRIKPDFPSPPAMMGSFSTGSYNEKSPSLFNSRGPSADPRRRACTLPHEAPAVLNHYIPMPKFSEPYTLARGLMREVVKNPQQNAKIAELCGEEAQFMVDFMNVVLHEENALATHEGRYILALLSKLAKTTQVFPRCYELKGVDLEDKPQGGGGFADIYRGAYEGKTICLKIVRLFQQQDNSRLLKAHVKELILWAHLRHQNILPFYGVYSINDERICIVSPWMNNGDLSRYLKNFPETSRNPLVSDIIAGLSYLHRSNIVHGDLKAPNVLVSDHGRALLADFGISTVVTSTGLIPSNTHTSNGTTRWIAPEVIAENVPAPTPESDIWSLSCLLYEVYTRKVPFYQYSDYKVIKILQEGQEIPLRPEVENQFDDIDDRVWELMTRCWSYLPEKRPSCEGLQKSFAELQFPDDRLPIPTNDESSGSALWKAMKAMSDFQIDCEDVLRILHRIRKDCVIAGWEYWSWYKTLRKTLGRLFKLKQDSGHQGVKKNSSKEIPR